MLEAVTDPKVINIGNLVLEEPRPKTINNLPFDPERDLDQKDWETISSKLLGEQNNAITILLARMARVISPKMIEELNLDQAWEQTKIRLERSWTRTDGQLTELVRAIDTASALLLFPEKRPEITPYYEKYKGEIRQPLDSGSPIDLIRDEFRTFPKLIMFPDLIYNLRSDADKKEAQKAYLKTNRPAFMQASGNLMQLVASAALFKLIYQENPYELDKEDWEVMMRKLNRMRQDLLDGGSLSDLINMAHGMKILAAEEARITEGGEVEVIMIKKPPVQSFDNPTPPMPERRKF